MDLRQLRQFVAVAEEHSFRRAAERLHMSQPPLSVSVQRLESELGVRLLERTKQGVRLTLAGEAFLEEARRTLAHAQLSIEIAQRAASGKLGTLRLSFVPSAGLSIVPRLLHEFRRIHPDVKLILTPETTARQLESLARGQIDVGVVVPPLRESQGLLVRPFTHEALMLAVPASHALARQAAVQLKDLASETFVGFSMEDGPGFESVVMTACQDNGFVPRFAQAASQMQAIVALVAAGHGVALVPAAMAAVHVEGTSFLRVRQRRGPVRYPLGIAWNPQRQNAALQAFVAMANRLPWAQPLVRGQFAGH